MTRIAKLVLVGAALMALGGCVYEDEYAYGGHGHIGTYEKRAGADCWYDGFYGPVYDGHWGEGGYYFAKAKGEPYQLDRDGHFRRVGGPGFGIHIGGGVAVSGGVDVGVGVH